LISGIERRLGRLEAVFGKAGCVCPNTAKVIVASERGKSPDEIERWIDQQLPRCPVHGYAPSIVVRISSFAGAKAGSEREPIAMDGPGQLPGEARTFAGPRIAREG
jgi:hypothetical protein